MNASDASLTVRELSYRLRKAAKAGVPLVRGSRPKNVPASYAQRRLWFIDRLQGSSAEYNLSHAVRLKGRIVKEALERAINRIVERHESLRTHFGEVDGDPVQVIEPELLIPVVAEDFGCLGLDEQKRQVKEAIEKASGEPFDLMHGPLFRVKLLKLGEDDHILVGTMHHIVSDGWSQAVFDREFGVLYQAYVDGRTDPLLPLPVQYADFALWQRAWLEGEVLDKQLEYWKGQLKGIPERLDLPTDRSRQALPTFAADIHRITIGSGHVKKLKLIGRDSQATLYMTLLTAFGVLLSRHSGQNDIVIGSPVANRSEPQTEEMIGFFVNSLVMRIQLSPEITFRSLLAQVRKTAIEAYQHQDVPFDRLVHELSPTRSLNTTPIFQVMLAFQNAPSVPLVMEGLKDEPLANSQLRTRFDLELHVDERKDELQLSWLYNQDLFDHYTIERMAGHYRQLLEAVAEAPEKRLWELELLTREERQQILVDWNETEREYTGRQCIHELFEEQVERTPDAIAVVFEDRQLSYGELNRRANQLGRHLGHNCDGETAVAVSLDRSIELVIAVIAILKVGGTIVPLDPNHPLPWVQAVMADTRPAAIVSCFTQIDQPDKLIPAITFVDQDWPVICQEDGENIGRQIHQDQLLYIIYTSGSTGRPKGIGLTHRVLVNLIEWHWATLSRGGSMLQYSPLSFDVSFLELFSTLCSGGSLHLITDIGRKDISRVARLLSDGLIETAILPAIALHELAEELSQRKDLTIDIPNIIVTGEQLQITSAIRLMFSRERNLLHNYYGPSETHVVTAFTLADNPRSWVSHTPIGRPISNVGICIVDDMLRPAPVGVAGEVCVWGACLARGYVNQPAQTAVQFIPCVFGGEPGARMYRTGDQARWTRTGDIEYLGRQDRQVKIRGYRVELNQVEAAMLADRFVTEAVAIARMDKDGVNRLIAYAVMKGASCDASGDLRRRLQSQLPSYLVPDAVVALEQLPVTANGKVNPHVLPMPVFHNRAGYQPPRSIEEEILCNFYREVLDIEDLGIDDNFFDLGGHSLLASRLASKITNSLESEVSIRTVFEAATVRELSYRLRKAAKAGVPLVRGSRPKNVPASYAQRRLWFIDRLQGSSAEYNLSHAVRLKGRIVKEALERAINRIVERHESLRTHFGEVDGDPVQVIEPELLIPVVAEDFGCLGLDEQKRQVKEAIEKASGEPFDLMHGPLFRVKLLKLGEDDHILVGTMHHIVSDGWSQAVFDREFGVLYQAYVDGRTDPLLPLPVQYADFALWQRAWLEGEVLDKQLEYWKGQLKGIPERLDLPTDRSRQALPTFAADIHRITIGSGHVKKLKLIGRDSQATLYMTLLTAFGVLLSRHSGQNDIVIGSPVANRSEPQTEEMIGFFVNSLVMRIQLSPEITFRSLLAQVRKTAIEAYQHQDVPFDRLVHELSPTRSLNTTPIFQVMLAFQNAPSVPLVMEGLKDEPLANSQLRTRFDLELHVDERKDELQLSWLYNQDLFDHYTIERMAGHYRQLLEAVAEAPEKRLWELELLTREERQQILVDWNETEREYTGRQCIHELFEEQVERTPDAIAVVFEDRQLSYGELNRRANGLARRLRSLGVEAESLVGLCVERSIEMVVGVLGILKSGGAYVPLDPGYPAERLAFMLEDAQVKAIVGDNVTNTNLPNFSEPIVCSHDIPYSDDAYTAPLPGVINHNNLAYVIYTSGSTGTPKGCMNAHNGVSNRLKWMQSQYGLNGNDRVLQKTPVSFDVSVWELFWPLISGATLIVAVPGGHQDAAYLVNLIVRERITTLHFVPSMLQVFLEENNLEERTDSVKRIICSGEALSPDLQNRCLAQINAELHNLYGPTETAVDVTYCQCQIDVSLRRVPIGRPIDNVQIYILNEFMQPVPPGVAGELFIGGAGVGRGYWRKAALTADKFEPNPFRVGERLYRTGDQAHWRPDGNLEYLGRLDQQLKLRGYRIEPGEIEAALLEQPGVKQAAVILREDEPGTKRLVAYVAATADDCALDPRATLVKRLPHYMIPSAFITMARLPLTPNGKLDRKALPRPDPHARATAAEEALSDIEERLVQVWKDVLRLSEVDKENNFFELGGDSITSVQIASRARHVNLLITPQQVFENQTIAELALVAKSVPIDLNKWEAVVGPVPMTPMQSWLFEHHDCPGRYTQAVFLRTVTQEHVAATLRSAFHILIKYHDALRLRFTLSEGQWVQSIGRCEASDIFGVVDLTDARGNSESELMNSLCAQVESSVDIGKGPLIRAVQFNLAQGSRLFIVAHHLVVDGISWRILLEDLDSICAQLERKQPVRLPAKTASYQQWAQALVEYANSPELRDERAYWYNVGQVKGAVVPRDLTQRGLGEPGCITVRPMSEAATREFLHKGGQRGGSRVEEMLLAALGAGLAEWIGRDRVLIDIEGHGRERIGGDLDLTRTVGWFTSLFPIVLEIRQSIHEQLAIAKQQLRRLPNGGRGFGVLRYLAPHEIRLPNPKTDFLFNYLGQLDAALLVQSRWLPASEPIRSAHNRLGLRSHMIEVVACILDGQLQIDWYYWDGIHHNATIEKVAQIVAHKLRELVEFLNPTSAVHKPCSADFPLAGLTQQELEAFTHEIDIERPSVKPSTNLK